MYVDQVFHNPMKKNIIFKNKPGLTGEAVIGEELCCAKTEEEIVLRGSIGMRLQWLSEYMGRLGHVAGGGRLVTKAVDLGGRDEGNFKRVGVADSSIE